MRTLAIRLTTIFGVFALAGFALVHGQSPAPQPAPPVQQAPTSQTPTSSTGIAADVPLAPELPPCPTVPPGLSDVGPMLDHIDAIVRQAIGTENASVSLAAAPTGQASGTPGTTGTMGSDEPTTMKINGRTANRVTIDRDKLDEVRAEVEQIKAILKK